MNIKDDEIAESHKLLAQYLSGDTTVTLDQIRDQEELDEYNFYLNKASFNIKELKVVMAFPVALYQIMFLR